MKGPVRSFHSIWLSNWGCIHIDENQTVGRHHGIWSGHEWWWGCVSISHITWPHTQHGSLYQVPGEDSVALDQEGSCWKTLYLTKGCNAMPHKQKNLVLDVRKFLQPHHPKHLPDSQIAIPKITMCGWGWENNKLLYNTKDELKERITAAFTNLNKETIGKACRRFWSHLEAGIKSNDNFFDYIYRILRYFHTILVNFTDRLRCQCYFHFYKFRRPFTYCTQFIYIYIYIYRKARQIKRGIERVRTLKSHISSLQCIHTRIKTSINIQLIWGLSTVNRLLNLEPIQVLICVCNSTILPELIILAKLIHIQNNTLSFAFSPSLYLSLSLYIYIYIYMIYLKILSFPQIHQKIGFTVFYCLKKLTNTLWPCLTSALSKLCS